MRTFLCLFFVWVTAVSTVQANNISFEGTFLTDDQVQLFDFTVTSESTVTFQSWGYGGGTNAAGTVIPPGGFETLFTWFAPDGTEIGSSAGYPCGSGNTYEGACLDAFANPTLTPGTYTLALTQEGNTSNGVGFPGDLGLGFSEQGQGDYTPITTDNPNCTAFCGTFGTQENGNWAVDISNVSSAVNLNSAPEPVTMLLAGCGLLALVGLARRRER